MGKAREERAEYKTDTQEIRHRNPIKELGFAAMEHALTLDTNLSDGSYRTYALLKFYWQNKYTAFPTVDTMATQRGLRRETVGVHLKELVDKGLITRQPRVGTSTLTHLEDLPQEYSDLALKELERRDARREENLTATLEKSNARREENLTQSTTIERELNNNNPLQDSWHKELEQLTGGYMGGGDAFRDLTDAWQRFPDVRRHTEAIRQTTAARSRTVVVYLKAFLTFNPDYVPPTYQKQSTYQRPKPGIGRASPPRASQAGGLDYSKPITEADRKRQFDEIMAQRRANGMSVPGG
jgi:DNA-binding MarR family transcriptional regulator